MRAILLLCFTLAMAAGSAQTLNRLNKHGQRTGRWITYEDSAKTIKSFEGKFRNGRQVGTAVYYKPGGVPDRKEVSRFGRLLTTVYYPNGNTRSYGKARLQNSREKIQYFFYGRWKYYDEQGQLYKYCYYKKGELIKTRYVGARYKINDSLSKALFALDTAFKRKGAFLVNMIGQNSDVPYKAEFYREKLYRFDSASFAGIEKLLRIYGYPSRYAVGDQVVVPFFILSYSPRTVREKYEALFRKAAEEGDIPWTSLAFYIDKLRVSFGKAQVYGTQFTFDKRGIKRYYPIEDPENLAARRKQMGLPEQQE